MGETEASGKSPGCQRKNRLGTSGQFNVMLVDAYGGRSSWFHKLKGGFFFDSLRGIMSE